MKGAGFAARLILSYFISGILHIYFGVPELEAFFIAFIIVMFPKFLASILKGGFKFGGKFAVFALRLSGSVLEGLFKVLKSLFDKRK